MSTLQTYPPSLFIGLGGAGIKSLRYLRKLFYQRDGHVIPPGCAFLGIDTDTTAFTDHVSQGPDADKIAFQPEECITLSADLQAISEQALPPHLDWLHPNIKKMMANFNLDTGSGQIRQLARLACCENATDIVQQIKQQHNNMLLMSSSDEERVDRQRAAHVHVIASLAGGTGSGILFDVLAMVQEALGTEVHITAWLVLPNAYKSVMQNDRNCVVNGASALRELNHYMSHAFQTQWKESDKVISVSSIFEQCFLVGGSNALGMVIDDPSIAYHQIANGIFRNYSTDSLATIMQSVRINRIQYLHNVIRADNGSGMWRTGLKALGVGEMEIKLPLSQLSQQELKHRLQDCWRRAQPLVHISRSHIVHESYHPIIDAFVAFPRGMSAEEEKQVLDIIGAFDAKLHVVPCELEEDDKLCIAIEISAFPIFLLSCMHGERGLNSCYINYVPLSSYSSHIVKSTEGFASLGSF